MESVVELQRQAHEEIERIEDAMARELARSAKTHKEKLAQETRVAGLLARVQERSAALLKMYADEDGSRKDELAAMSGSDMNEYYKRFKAVREYHRAFANMPVASLDSEIADAGQDRSATIERLELLFSGEESLGRYIDLHAQHDLFLNLPFVKRSEDRPSYMRFLSEFDRFPDIAREDKGGDYRAYVASLHDYLLGFMRRARPLFETDAAMTKADADFAERWERGEVPGWPRASADEGLYCVACDRLFNKQTVFDSHLPGKKHQKALARLLEATQGKQPDDATVTAKRLAAIKLGQEGERETARLEFRISLLAELLGSVREDTKGNVERRQLRTAEERAEDAELEVEAPIQAEHDDSDEEEKPIYNPLNLPLGWDGKPIPYWLYRLHGLGVAYTCQICGDYTFMGRKAFERHFGEWRHTQALKRFGIQNSKHFQEVTQIQDALALWERLRKDRTTAAFRPEHEEEYEDSAGNVFNRKTFEDLKRQGIL